MNQAAQSFGPDDILELLMDRLNRRGILLVQIPRFIKDVMNILAEDGALPEDAVNGRMVRLGWGEQVLNGYILELIRFLIENPGKPAGVTSPPFIPVSRADIPTQPP